MIERDRGVAADNGNELATINADQVESGKRDANSTINDFEFLSDCLWDVVPDGYAYGNSAGYLNERKWNKTDQRTRGSRSANGEVNEFEISECGSDVAADAERGAKAHTISTADKHSERSDRVERRSISTADQRKSGMGSSQQQTHNTSQGSSQQQKEFTITPETQLNGDNFGDVMNCMTDKGRMPRERMWCYKQGLLAVDQRPDFMTEGRLDWCYKQLDRYEEWYLNKDTMALNNSPSPRDGAAPLPNEKSMTDEQKVWVKDFLDVHNKIMKDEDFTVEEAKRYVECAMLLNTDKKNGKLRNRMVEDIITTWANVDDPRVSIVADKLGMSHDEFKIAVAAA